MLAAGIDPYDSNAAAPHEIVSFTSSFHGRTMGALALTYKQQYKTPFSPMIGGAKMVKWLDFEAVAEAVQKVPDPTLSLVSQIARYNCPVSIVFSGNPCIGPVSSAT